ncbi:MAG TPA: helix-turn-helix domain-containing protein [Nocardioidaceae bacterium]|nr:helix-turn-helix domain-containing protein [Nocardioidaceae bacterium]
MPRLTQAERRETTRASLLAAGRKLFATLGYDAVAAEQIVAEAGVTRGALYHHFDGKAGLFEAVFVELEHELVAQFPLDELLEDPFQALRSGVVRFLDQSLHAEVQQIALIDAPSVLGWARWQEIEAEAGLGLLRAGLEAAMTAGQLKKLPVDDLATALLGSLTETALSVARAKDRKAARKRAEVVLQAMLDGLRP